MTSRRRSLLLDGLFVGALLLLLIPALQPLLGAQFTCGYDNAFHTWRAVEVELLLQEGMLFSRWAPHMAHGYGYPLFNFSAPASAYAAALLHSVGFSWGWALNGVFIAGWVLSALAAYGFVSRRLGRPAGLVGAVVYAYVPFHAYDVFYRGGLSQASAWFLPPLILWALPRAGRRAGFATVALATAALVLTHNAFAYLFAPLLVAYLPVVVLREDRRAAWRGGLALALGLGLSVFFWLPALYELRFVLSGRLSGAWVFRYENNFLPLDQLFALPRNADPALINDWPARGLGLLPALVAPAGLVGLRDKRRRVEVALFAAVLGACLFLTLPAARPVWDALPPLQRVQFPWRLVGPAALCAAFLAGAATRAATRAVAARAPALACLPACALVLLLLVPHLGWFYPHHCAPPGPATARGMIAWEQATATLGTTALGEFLPLWVERLPEGSPIGPEGEVQRFDTAALPAGGELLEARYGATRVRLVVDAPAPFRARLLTFYYPGWRAWVDGEPVKVTPSDPHGLITFDVPAGHHTVDVRFGETPLRRVADLLSLLSLLATAALLVRSPAPTPSPGPSGHEDTHSIAHLPLVLLALAIPLLKLAVVDRVENPLRHSDLEGAQLEGVDVPAQVTFDGQFRLLGHDALPNALPADRPITLGLYWQDAVPGGPDYRPALSLQDGRGRAWSEPDARPSRWHQAPPPARTWPPDSYAAHHLQLFPLPGTPPGTYTVTLTVFDLTTLAPYPARDADGGLPGLEVPLGRVELGRPRQPFSTQEVPRRHAIDLPYGPLRLIGYNLDRAQAAPGDPFGIALFWQADETPQADAWVRLQLLDPAGEEVLAHDLPLAHAGFPTSRWRAGDLWRGQHVLRLPAGLESGIHRWVLQVCEGDGTCRPLGAPAELGTVSVDAPRRRWEPPAMDVEVNAKLGGQVSLLGAEVPALRAGRPFTVTLVWRAEAEIDTPYRVFLHLLGPDGNAVAQSDGEPAGWTRPTTGWLPGEIVPDTRILELPAELPAGTYPLRAGMYVLGGERLRTPEGADGVTLATLEVGEE